MQTSEIPWEEKNSKITCIECNDKVAWIGTSNGKVHMGTVESKVGSSFFGEKRDDFLITRSIQISNSKIVHIEYLKNTDSLVVLSDGSITLLDATAVTEIIKIPRNDDTRNLRICRDRSLKNQVKDGDKFAVLQKTKKKLSFSHSYVINIYDLNRLDEAGDETLDTFKSFQIPNVSSDPLRMTYCHSHIGLLFNKNSSEFYNISTELVDTKFYKNNLRKLSDLISNSSVYLPFLDIVGGNYQSFNFSNTNLRDVKCSYPYVIAVDWNTGVEIRNLLDSKTSISKEFNHGFQIAISKNITYVVSANSLCVLRPNTVDTDMTEYILKGEIKNAFRVLNQRVRDPDSFKYKEYVKKYRLLSALYEFKNLKFNRAIDNFKQLKDCDPRELLMYFKEVNIPNFEFESKYKDIHSLYKPELDDIRKIIKDLHPEGDHILTINVKNAFKNGSIFVKARRKELLKQRRNITSNEVLEYERVLRSIDYFLLYYCCIISFSLENSQFLKSFLLNDNYILEEGIKETIFDQNVTLLPYYGYFLWGKGKREKAIEFLKTRKEMEAKDKVIELLLESKSIEMIMSNLEFLLDSIDDKKSIIMLLTINDGDFILPHEAVLELLIEYPVDIQTAYMEFLVYERDFVHYSTNLALYYIKSILKLKSEMTIPVELKVAAGEEVGLLGELRKKLLTLLRSENPEDGTKYYDINVLLRKIEHSVLHEEKIELYKQKNDSSKVLKLLLFSQDNKLAAEQYCIDCYREETENGMVTSPYNAHLKLLIEICFNVEPYNREFGISLLRKYSNVVDPNSILKIIPETMPFSTFAFYFEKAIKNTEVLGKRMEVMLPLSKLKYARNKSLLARIKSRRQIITEHSLCPVCQRPLGASVLAVFPDDTCVHVSCCKKKVVHSKSGFTTSTRQLHINPVTTLNHQWYPFKLKMISEEDVLVPPISM
mmetsp:Transcript_8592/g.12666  ORF Transcript_8592/g.12666 Transcript_8592/m.12666 type:complete len:937 (-) Transcript_8592:47-2857(-)